MYGIFVNSFLDFVKFDRNLLSRLGIFKKKIVSLKNINNIRTLDLFEKPINHKNEIKKIFYQKRCFPNEPNDDIKAIHLQRYNIVKLLKKHFNNIFEGGLSDSEIVREKFLDARTNLSSNPSKFLKKMNECDIVIYTRGISDSIGYTLPEAFSQNKVVISEQIKNNLPFDILNEKEVLFFNDDKSMLKAIESVINDDKMFNKLKGSGREYFEKYIHPKVNMVRILKIMGCEI
jgi:hypothetical protein